MSGSNANFKTKKALSSILIGKENIATLEIERDNQIKQIQVNRYNFKDFNYWYNPKIKSTSINNNIGYINMTGKFGVKEFDEIFEHFKSKKTIIVDLRGYPQLKYKMYTRYFNSKKRDIASKYTPNIHYPGNFYFHENIKTNNSKKAFKGKFIILVSEDCLSLSEFTIMAFQTADNVITIGNQTAGADGRNIKIDYLGGYKTYFTGIGISYPDGSESQRKGVKIDIEIKPTINGLRQGRDEVLEKAIEVANK